MKFETSLRFAPAHHGSESATRFRLIRRDEFSLLEAQSRLINDSVCKRGLDIAIAAALILFLLPALIVIALAIKATSPGPILFRQRRYGGGGRIFRILKFRTMRVTEEGPFQQASRQDSRVTPIGAWLRKSSLDELPQLLNVLSGAMSLVGPRPHALAMDDYYREIIPNYALRHLVRPGVTGLAQVSGYRGPTDSLDAIVGRVAHDIAYIRAWSPMTDIILLLRTPAALFGGNAF